MPCLVLLLALISPRLALFALWLFSDVLSDAYDSWILPLLGFFVLPWTTLAYAGMYSAGVNEVYGFEWFIVGLAFVIDLGSTRRSGSCSAEAVVEPSTSATSPARPAGSPWASA